jgi:predicted dehydrogenase
MTKVAIIGTGGIAGSHVDAIQHEAHRANLVAAVDIREDAVQAFCDKHQIPTAYTNVTEMLDREQPDLVHICTPPTSHAELSIACMRAGAWVLCEKPLTASLQEVDAIISAEQETGKFTSSVYQWRFGAGGGHLKRLMKDDALGRPLLGICQTVWYRDDAYYAVPWRGTWQHEAGGCSMGHGIHAMDFFLWMYGPWSEVTAKMNHLNHDIEVEDVSLALVDFENGAMGSIINSVVSPRQESYIRMDFVDATVEMKHLYAYKNKDWTYSLAPKSAKEDVLESWQQLPDDSLSPHTAQLQHVLDCMEAQTQPMTSGAGARMTLEFIASMYKSAFTGESVKRGSIIQDDPFYSAMNGGMVL